jgi:hypothetical protein
MKKVLIVAVLLLCGSQAFGQLVITQKKAEPVEKEKNVSAAFLDFRPYTSSGFFISGGPYRGDFDPIGDIEIRVDPKTVRNGDRRKASDPVYLVETVKHQELINLAVEYAKSVGADALVNFRITAVEYEADIVFDNPVNYYLITGSCISRKKSISEVPGEE